MGKCIKKIFKQLNLKTFNPDKYLVSNFLTNFYIYQDDSKN